MSVQLPSPPNRCDSPGRTVGPGKELAHFHVSLLYVPADVIHLLEGLTSVFRTGSFSTAQHAQTANVHLHTVQHPTRDVVMMVMKNS